MAGPFRCKRHWRHLTRLTFIFWMGLFSYGWCADERDRLAFSLPAPSDPTARTYLGLTDQERFTLGEIETRLLIVQIFSMYCPICQKEATDLNALYRRINADPQLKDQVKLIGIGAGNSDFEVNVFRDKYQIPFPLFSDPDFTLHQRIGAVRTPHFFGLIVDENDSFRLFYNRSGEIDDPERFLDTLITASKGALRP